MAYACIDVDSLSNVTFNDVCVASNLLHNETAWPIIQDALLTCCGRTNVHTTGSGCYTYCNISTPYDTVMINNCLLDTLDQDTSDVLDFDCFPFAWELSSTTDTRAGMIATTWSFPDQTFTDTETTTVSGVQLVETTTETFDYWGNVLTTATKMADAGKITGGATSGSSATITGATVTGSGSTAAATSSKASMAVGGKRVSYGAGLLVAMSVLALVL
jgi:hypothetical protein